MQVYIQLLEEENARLVDQMETSHSLKNSYADLYSQDVQAPGNPKVYRSFHNHRNNKLYTESSEDRSEAGTTNMDVLIHQLTEEKASHSRARAIIDKYS